MYRTNKPNQGFTIIELMFAMAFVAALLIAIASLVIQMSVIYNRGITLREVNQSGRNIVDVMTRDISEAQPFKLSSALVDTADGGRLCTGTVTYAWSSLKDLDDSNDARHPMTFYNDGTPVRFVRIEDPGALYCHYDKDGLIYSQPVDRDRTTELLNHGQRDLVLRGFSIKEIPDDPNHSGPKIYVVRATIGTNDNDFISVSKDNRCEPGEGQTERGQSYCAINEFKFAARAGNVE